MRRWAIASAILASVAVVVGVVTPAHAASERRAGHRVAMVTVVDHTAGQWPGIANVVASWSRSRYMDATLAGQCKRRTYCVTVEAAAYGATPWHGQTTFTSQLSAAVQLNLSVPADATLQSAVFCHEMGHTLGIAHPAPDADRPGVHGCIASTDSSLTTPLPSGADVAQLHAILNGKGLQGTPQYWGAMWMMPTIGRWR